MSKSESPAWQKWREIIERQQASGLSVAAFCRNNGVADSSFFTWKRKLAASATCASAASSAAAAAVTVAAGFVEATVPDLRRRAGSIQVRLRGGRRLLLRSGFDRDLLAEVVAFFEGRS